MNLTLKPPPDTNFLEFPDTQHLDGQYPNTQPGTGQPQCTHGDRMCEDGSCISGVDLCSKFVLIAPCDVASDLQCEVLCVCHVVHHVMCCVMWCVVSCDVLCHVVCCVMWCAILFAMWCVVCHVM